MPPIFAVFVQVPGSRVVLVVLTVIFSAILFACAWRGYWRGPIRQLAPLAAFLLSATVAWFLGADFGHLALGVVGVPWILRGICGTVLLGLFIWIPVFGFLWRSGRFQVSEKNGEPEHPILGAIVGCWTGIFWSSLIVLCAVAAGSIGETLLATRKGTMRSVVGRAFYIAATVKNSVALYPRLAFLKTWSPLPEETVRLIRKTLDVFGSRLARQRITQVPSIQAVITDPAVYPVLNDAEIQAMIAARDIDGLLADPRVRRMMTDENFQRRISELRLEPILDFALGRASFPPGEMPEAENQESH